MKVIIQGIPERIKGIRRIKESLGDTECVVHLDKKRINAYVTLIDMLMDYSNDDYRLTIQDDAILCNNFSESLPLLEEYMKKNDADVLSLYVPNHNKLTQKYTDGFTGVMKPAKTFFPCVCYILSPKIQKELLLYSCTGSPKETKHDDDFIVEYCVKKKLPIFTIIPSMVQHDIGIPSSLGHANTDRRTSRIFEKEFFTTENLKEILNL
jgi:hypothetical protein